WRLVPGSTAVDTNAKPYGWRAGRRAVDDHLRRVGIAGVAVRGRIPGTYRVHRDLDPATTVSIIIPTRGGSGTVWGRRRCFVVEAVRSALANTAHRNLEIVVVADTATPPAVIRELGEIADDRLVLVDFVEPFNFSRKCNAGYLAARGEVLLFLNDDVEVITDGWLEALVAPLAEPDVGLVGAKLLYSDGSVQHGGHLYERHGFTHAFHGSPADSRAGFSALQLDREVTGVTAACVAIRRETFAQVGGFCAGLPGNFNDVDFCFKIRKAGFRILALAQVELFHFESRSREPRVYAWEEDVTFGRWGSADIDEYLPHRSGRINNPPGEPPRRRLNGYSVNAQWPPA
ncbi:MAG TPA: glycosyltransferase, partial [Jatrophihabitantaceae bacterium]|nr:glycosyltransferase [Jatrophihabitantaceae bacterium]